MERCNANQAQGDLGEPGLRFIVDINAKLRLRPHRIPGIYQFTRDSSLGWPLPLPPFWCVGPQLFMTVYFHYVLSGNFLFQSCGSSALLVARATYRMPNVAPQESTCQEESDASWDPVDFGSCHPWLVSAAGLTLRDGVKNSNSPTNNLSSLISNVSTQGH